MFVRSQESGSKCRSLCSSSKSVQAFGDTHGLHATETRGRAKPVVASCFSLLSRAPVSPVPTGANFLVPSPAGCGARALLRELAAHDI